MPANNQCDSEFAKTRLGGCSLSHLKKPDLLNLVKNWIQTGSKGHYITAINVSKLVAMQSDEKLAKFIKNSSVNIADGAPVFTATRLVGKPLPERITGVDLMDDLLQLASENGFRVYFFGSRQEVLDKVLARCDEEYPGLIVAGARNGYFDKELESEIVSDIAASDADMLLVALGIPQKEYFVDDHLQALNVSLVLPVGGGFDVFGGLKPRAPQWVQKIGIEWMWRSLYDRSKAGLVGRSLLPFIHIVLRETARQRFSSMGNH